MFEVQQNCVPDQDREFILLVISNNDGIGLIFIHENFGEGANMYLGATKVELKRLWGWGFAEWPSLEDTQI